MSKFFDEGVRVESLIYIQGALTDDSAFPDSFKEFCECMPEDSARTLYAQLPVLARYADEDEEPEPSAVAETLVMGAVRGFLVQAATPVKTYYPDGNGFTYSWGHYHTEWLYAPDEEAIERVCVVWCQASDAKDRAKSIPVKSDAGVSRTTRQGNPATADLND